MYITVICKKSYTSLTFSYVSPCYNLKHLCIFMFQVKKNKVGYTRFQNGRETIHGFDAIVSIVFSLFYAYTIKYNSVQLSTFNSHIFVLWNPPKSIFCWTFHCNDSSKGCLHQILTWSLGNTCKNNKLSQSWCWSSLNSNV